MFPMSMPVKRNKLNSAGGPNPTKMHCGRQSRINILIYVKKKGTGTKRNNRMPRFHDSFYFRFA